MVDTDPRGMADAPFQSSSVSSEDAKGILFQSPAAQVAAYMAYRLRWPQILQALPSELIKRTV